MNSSSTDQPVELGRGSAPIEPMLKLKQMTHSERRGVPRKHFEAPLVVIPVLDDFRPGAVHWADATTVDVSNDGLGFIVEAEQPISTRLIVVGSETPSGERTFATMRIEFCGASPEGRTRIGASWRTGTEDDILLPELFRPSIQPQTLSFGYRWPQSLIEAWAELGVIQPYLIDRVLLCKGCGSLPSWRRGCNSCGSGRIYFEPDQIECFDCGTRGSQPTLWALCHACSKRFDATQADERALYAYHVNRLDPRRLAITMQ